MLKKKKILSLIMTTVLLMGTLAGCGGASKETASSSAGGDKTITIWSHMDTASEFPKLQEVADKWAKEKGVKVNVVDDKGKIQDYIQAAGSSQAPDIMVGIAHDNLGTFQKAGLLAEVPSGFLDESKYNNKGLIDAVTIGGKQYGVPYAGETVALYVNKDKVKEVPKTFEDVVTKAKEPGIGLVFSINNFYYDLGFLTGQGGYIFKNTNGTVDPSDIGLGNDGAIKGFQFLQDLVIKDKLIAADTTDDIARSRFMSGDAAFFISGAWDAPAAKSANVNYEIVPMPTLGGKPVTTALGVQTAFVAEKSPNKDLAWDCMKYIKDNIEPIIIESGRIPATKAGVESDAFKKNKDMVAFGEQSKVAVPMPNIPEIQNIWAPGGNLMLSMSDGTNDPKTTGTELVKQIKEGIAQSK
ncbi:maltose ABC transporter substrate-binding protein [Clostridium gelidum]|uniref:Maltodextrin-binding protein n=1 Tax=Clostridium gelidum TaxID=704125 RepID=A0ABN6J441_9CLOT|nr:maltose ABC transporter substrate-binding protein [Clostridium gelidum]BCZ47414.1 maltose ABC transporter substrate-binding protein [Clostridium gelidum]